MRPAAHVSDGARSGGSGAHAQPQTSSRHPPAQPPPQQILRVAVDPPRGPLCNHCWTRVQIDEEIIATKCNHAFCHPCARAELEKGKCPVCSTRLTSDDVRSMHVQEDVSSELIGVHPLIATTQLLINSHVFWQRQHTMEVLYWQRRSAKSERDMEQLARSSQHDLHAKTVEVDRLSLRNDQLEQDLKKAEKSVAKAEKARDKAMNLYAARCAQDSSNDSQQIRATQLLLPADTHSSPSVTDPGRLDTRLLIAPPAHRSQMTPPINEARGRQTEAYDNAVAASSSMAFSAAPVHQSAAFGSRDPVQSPANVPPRISPMRLHQLDKSDCRYHPYQQRGPQKQQQSGRGQTTTNTARAAPQQRSTAFPGLYHPAAGASSAQAYTSARASPLQYAPSAGMSGGAGRPARMYSHQASPLTSVAPPTPRLPGNMRSQAMQQQQQQQQQQMRVVAPTAFKPIANRGQYAQNGFGQSRMPPPSQPPQHRHENTPRPSARQMIQQQYAPQHYSRGR